MSLLDTNPNIDIERTVWEPYIQERIIGYTDIQRIRETMGTRDIIIPDGITELLGEPFMYMRSLDSVSIPANCIMSRNVFFGAEMERIECRGPVEVYTQATFIEYIPRLKEATVRVGEWGIWPLVSNCTDLEVLRLGGIKRICKGMIRHCPKLTTVYLDPDVKEVTSDAFDDCPSLVNIIPDNPEGTITPLAYKLLGRSGDL